MNLNRWKNWKLPLALLCAMTLMACGGGGGGGDPVATPTPTPTPTPQLNILQVEVTEDDTSATITWLTDRAATDVVQYGETTSYGSQETNVIAATSHRVELTGLTVSTLYNFQITSTDPDGIYPDDVYSGNFTTEATPVTGPSSITDDYFDTDKSNFDNDPLWTFYDPIGLATATVSGGYLQIYLPAGTAHDAWEPNNYAARLMQTVKNEDFQLTVKFDSPVSDGFQDQGIMIEESGCNWLRFDVFYDHEDNIKMYAAIFHDTDSDNVADLDLKISEAIDPQPAATQSPYYLRVTRRDPNWLFEYSLNGTDYIYVIDFDHSLTVNTVGPYAGNYNLSNWPVPEHTALVDYFDVTIPPPPL